MRCPLPSLIWVLRTKVQYHARPHCETVLLTAAPLHRRWGPKWVEVQVIAYSGIQPIFSLLWADPGRHWRHIMDFKAMQLSQRPPLSEML